VQPWQRGPTGVAPDGGVVTASWSCRSCCWWQAEVLPRTSRCCFAGAVPKACVRVPDVGFGCWPMAVGQPGPSTRSGVAAWKANGWRSARREVSGSWSWGRSRQRPAPRQHHAASATRSADRSMLLVGNGVLLTGGGQMSLARLLRLDGLVSAGRTGCPAAGAYGGSLGRRPGAGAGTASRMIGGARRNRRHTRGVVDQHAVDRFPGRVVNSGAVMNR
jgi:hypothetical protein